MRLLSFTAKDLHGFLSLSLKFFPNITYLTGINGCGKTTLVNSVAALLGPSLARLASFQFSQLSVTIEDSERTLTISARKDPGSLALETSETPDPLVIPILQRESYDELKQQDERDAEYYLQLEATKSEHPVLALLRKLPTPMILGLERRDAGADLDRLTPYVIRHRRRSRNAFSPSLSRSLLEAASLAEVAHRKVLARQRELTTALRDNIILSALQLNPLASVDRLGDLTVEDVHRIGDTLAMLDIAKGKIAAHLKPILDELKLIQSYSPFEGQPGSILQAQDDRSRAYLSLLTNGPHFDRMASIVKHVNTYLEGSDKASRQIRKYLDVVNNFLGDSGKRLAFGRTSELELQSERGCSVHIDSLSSGESQIVVILTHLAFNEAARANVFIVDEPELSLHLRWQELFVESVSSFHPKLQVILATHSPSIIRDDVRHCIDLGTVTS